MRVELGNTSPAHSPSGQREALPGPAVTYVNIPDEYSVGDSSDIGLVQQHLAQRPDGVTNLPNHEALLAIVHPGGVWASHGSGIPSWVWSDNEEFAIQLGAYFGCPVGHPEDLEATHFTTAGPPGVGPLNTEVAA